MDQNHFLSNTVSLPVRAVGDFHESVLLALLLSHSVSGWIIIKCIEVETLIKLIVEHLPPSPSPPLTTL